MERFVETEHCKSRAHCRSCRLDSKWRAGIADHWGLEPDFDCPYGITAESVKEVLSLPPLTKMAGNLAREAFHAARALAGGSELCVPDSVMDERLDLCRACDYFREEGNRCTHTKCGCFLKIKTHYAPMRCPIGKWVEYRKE